MLHRWGSLVHLKHESWLHAFFSATECVDALEIPVDMNTEQQVYHLRTSRWRAWWYRSNTVLLVRRPLLDRERLQRSTRNWNLSHLLINILRKKSTNIANISSLDSDQYKQGCILLEVPEDKEQRIWKRNQARNHPWEMTSNRFSPGQSRYNSTSNPLRITSPAQELNPFP